MRTFDFGDERNETHDFLAKPEIVVAVGQEAGLVDVKLLQADFGHVFFDTTFCLHVEKHGGTLSASRG